MRRYIAERYIAWRVRRGRRDRCWCGGELLPFKWHRSYGVCAQCGCYVNRRPPIPEELAGIYSMDRYWGKVSEMRGHPPLQERADLYRSDGRLDGWLNLVKRFGPKQGTVLEVGCAPGVLLAELQSRGYKCMGVEPDPQVAEWISNNIHVEVRAGLFPELDLPPCDMFLAFDVLEHSLCPEKFLQKVHDLLVDGGTAIFVTPIELQDIAHPFKEAPGFFGDVEHAFLFTDKSVRALARCAQLEVVAVEPGKRPGHEVVVVREEPKGRTGAVGP